MFDVINALFDHYEFKKKPLKGGGFYWEKPGQEYWVVIKEDAGTVLDKQEEYSEECKALCSDPALDKNISMLVLWETDGKLDHETFKRNKMQIEEDQFYFKKYVLGYAGDELVELKKKIDKRDVADYIEESIVSKEIFDLYKEDPFVLKWHSLLYRIAIKVPFLKIKGIESEGLESLFAQNNAVLAKEGILSFNDELMKTLEQCPREELEATDAKDLFESVLPFVEKLNAGN